MHSVTINTLLFFRAYLNGTIFINDRSNKDGESFHGIKFSLVVTNQGF